MVALAYWDTHWHSWIFLHTWHLWHVQNALRHPVRVLSPGGNTIDIGAWREHETRVGHTMTVQ